MMSGTIFLKTIQRCWPALLIGAAWLWIFWPIIIGEQVVGFRDSAYLYYPLFQWIDAQWAAGSIPLWNPYCNFGVPVVHDGSSSVFYPGKLIFFIRALPYPARYGIYIAMHVPIAATGTYWFARVLNAKRIGATLAAVSFSFGGFFLFQTTNVVYLVSAAWLPFALCTVWLMFRQTKLKWAIWTGVFCALMILGGDPQMCYHVGLVMVGFAGWRFLRERRRLFKSKTTSPLRVRPYRRSLDSIWLIATTVVVTFGLAAIQILPSYVWSQDSVRTDFHATRNIYEALGPNPERIDRPIVAGLVGTPEPGTHHDHLYQFSQPPWTLAELIWPNFSGKPYPVHQRWVDGLPGAERMWTPSIYMGCFVIVLALAAFNPLSRNRKFAWLSRIALFFGIASLGWYGPVWLVNEVAPNLLKNQGLGAPTGGLYWCMVVLLPKYVTFRYPAKLLILALLALSVLAGLQLERSVRKKQTKAISIVVSLFLLGSLGVFLLSNQISLLGGELSSELFGPFDAALCRRGIQFSTGIVSLVLIACTMLIRCRFRLAATCVLLICCTDVLVMNSWLVPKVDSEVFEEPIRWTQWMGSNEIPAFYRSSQAGSAHTVKMEFPPSWSTTSSKQRLTEIASWQRSTLQPKHHLEFGIQLIGSFYSVEPARRPHEKPPSLSGAFQLYYYPPELMLTPIASSNNSFVKTSDWPPNVKHEWTSSNQFKLMIFPDTDQPEKSEYFCNLQPVGGWTYFAKDNETGEMIIEPRPFTRTKENMSILVPPGRELSVTATYNPLEFIVGAWISGVAWVAILCGFVAMLWRRTFHAT